MKKGIYDTVLTLAGGVAAGFVNGMLGTGGGIILVFLLGYLMKRERGYNTRDVFATVIASILPMSLVSAWLYLKNGSVGMSDALPYITPGILGGLAGAYLLDKINLTLLKKLFAALVIYAGVKMMV
ncbi:MAG: sulfite exporter TauE/SafE family protein [Clostridia bacterium]|nr:sulfite exporter TauE/SafE family protein [Clostridia bacterium]